MLKKLDHSALVVRDLDRASWFYGEVLGLQEVPRPSTFTFRGRWFAGESFQVHLILEDDTTAPAGFAEPGAALRSGLCHHLAFEVDALETMQARLQGYGLETFGPLPRGDGVVQIYVNDPDGNFLEFFERRTALLPQTEERKPMPKA